MCEHGTDVAVQVWVPADLSCTGEGKWKVVGVDSCIAPIVDALQRHGIDMRGSCCGHGRREGHVELQDGRLLLVLSPAMARAYMGAVSASSQLAVVDRAGPSLVARLLAWIRR